MNRTPNSGDHYNDSLRYKNMKYRGYVNSTVKGIHVMSAFMAGKSSSLSRIIETKRSTQAREAERVEVMVGIFSQKLHMNLV